MSDKNKKAMKKQLRKEKEENKTTAQVIFEYVRVIAIGALIAFLLCKFVIINAVVPSGSMIPTINKGERLIGFRLAYKFSEPERGDIIIFKCPEEGADYNKLFIKRLIGLPGETVTIRAGEVWITPADGGEQFKLDEDYLYETPSETAQVNNMSYTVGEDEYFFMGDNRNNSHDCRYFGTVSKDRLVAKAVWKYWKGFEIMK